MVEEAKKPEDVKSPKTKEDKPVKITLKKIEVNNKTDEAEKVKKIETAVKTNTTQNKDAKKQEAKKPVV